MELLLSSNRPVRVIRSTPQALDVAFQPVLTIPKRGDGGQNDSRYLVALAAL
jgi:hypothetical protein